MTSNYNDYKLFVLQTFTAVLFIKINSNFAQVIALSTEWLHTSFHLSWRLTTNLARTPYLHLTCHGDIDSCRRAVVVSVPFARGVETCEARQPLQTPRQLNQIALIIAFALIHTDSSLL